MIEIKLEDFIVDENTPLNVAMQKIDDNSNGVVFVVDKNNHLCGAVSDGDIRRWLLKAGSLDSPVHMLMKKTPASLNVDERDKAPEVMKNLMIRSLPLVDAEGMIVDLILLRNEEKRALASKESLKGVSVVIMAGGKGTRLYPYTKILPKPLIPIGDIPIVQRVIDKFNDFGVTDFFMTVNFKKNMIQSYFNDIDKPYDLEYVEETKPLGTGGSLKLIARKFDEPIFVANCDSLIRTDYSVLYEHHKSAGNAITIVTSMKNDTIPYGVIYPNEEGKLEKMVEKPTRSYLINTGMYVINPDMIDLIPDDEMFHMTHLVDKAMEQGYTVGIYPVSEDSFLDMGEFTEMKRMEEKLGFENKL